MDARGFDEVLVLAHSPVPEGDRALCIAAGMDDYVTQPIRVDQPVDAPLRPQPRKDVRIA